MWACRDCASALCRPNPIMPDLALPNWMWLGRVHPSYKNLSLGMRLLLGRGRPVMRQLYLGRGPRDEVHKGLQGNTMIIAQPSAQYAQVMPSVSQCLSSLVLMFCNSVDDVSKAHTLVVERDQYAKWMQRRIEVCPTFQDVKIDLSAMRDELPEVGVPQALSLIHI